MSNLPNPLIEHFHPLHSMLREFATKADEAWPEGGMTWNVEYRHRGANTVKIDGIYLARSQGTAKKTSLQVHEHMWAKLIWRAHGDTATLMNISDEIEWEKEEKRLISEHCAQAQQVISHFDSSGADWVHMSFDDDDLSIAAFCILGFGCHALVYNIFWSMD